MPLRLPAARGRHHPLFCPWDAVVMWQHLRTQAPLSSSRLRAICRTYSIFLSLLVMIRAPYFGDCLSLSNFILALHLDLLRSAILIYFVHSLPESCRANSWQSLVWSPYSSLWLCDVDEIKSQGNECFGYDQVGGMGALNCAIDDVRGQTRRCYRPSLFGQRLSWVWIFLLSFMELKAKWDS